mgnify:CR=1 FL=1
MSEAGRDENSPSGLALAGVQFFFTLGWTVYVIYLPGLLKGVGIAASWLPWLLMADQLVFAVMDIAFGLAADRMAGGYQKLARLLLVLTSVSAAAFLLIPLAGVASAGLLLFLLAIWVISASVVRAPTLILLAKRAKAAQQGQLVVWYTGGIALAFALSPFLGLWLQGVDPRLPFGISALVLVLAVGVLLRAGNAPVRSADDEVPQPLPYQAYLPLLLVLGLAGLGFQMHAFVNAAPMYQALAPKENLPWLLPLLWLGFFVALPVLGKLVKRFGALTVAATGILLTALSSYAATQVDVLGTLIVWQLLTGIGWALAFAGLMEQASADGTRGAEGLFMGSFFAVTAISSFARIGFATQYLPTHKDIQFALPASLLLATTLLATLYAFQRRQACQMADSSLQDKGPD